MEYTIDIETLEDGLQQVTVAWANGFAYTTTCIGTPEQAKWHAENAIVPDMRLRYPELRGDVQ
jgi:hypothetical protein